MDHLPPNGARTCSSPYDQCWALTEDTKRNPNSDLVKTMEGRTRKNDSIFSARIFWVIIKMYLILWVVKCTLAIVLLRTMAP